MALLLLAACSYHEQKPQHEIGMGFMNGLTAERLFAIYGPPSTAEQLSDGGMKYSWSRSTSRVVPGWGRPDTHKVHEKSIGQKIIGYTLDVNTDHHDAGDIDEDSCRFEVTTRGGIVSDVQVNEEGDDACEEFYNKWRVQERQPSSAYY